MSASRPRPSPSPKIEPAAPEPPAAAVERLPRSELATYAFAAWLRRATDTTDKPHVDQ